MSETKTYPLRLPRSLKDAVERISKEEGTSINQFVATAVAEKVFHLPDHQFGIADHLERLDLVFGGVAQRG